MLIPGHSSCSLRLNICAASIYICVLSTCISQNCGSDLFLPDILLGCHSQGQYSGGSGEITPNAADRSATRSGPGHQWLQ